MNKEGHSPGKYPFEFTVDEDFYQAHQRKESIMIITEGDTHIVYLEGYVPLSEGRYKLYGSNPPPGKESYKSVVRMRRALLKPGG